MKKYLLFIPLLLLGACKEEWRTGIDLKHEMEFEINSSVATFSGSKVLDPTTNEKFKENVDKIKDIQIGRISYSISEFNGPPTQTANVLFEFADASGDNKRTLGTLTNLELGKYAGFENDLNVTPDSFAALAALLKTPPNKFTIYNSGSFNQVPAKFKMKIRFYNTYKFKILTF